MFRSPTKEADKLVQLFDSMPTRLAKAEEALNKGIQRDEQAQKLISSIAKAAAQVVVWVIERLAALEDKARWFIGDRLLDKRISRASIRYRRAHMMTATGDNA